MVASATVRIGGECFDCHGRSSKDTAIPTEDKPEAIDDDTLEAAQGGAKLAPGDDKKIILHEEQETILMDHMVLEERDAKIILHEEDVSI